MSTEIDTFQTRMAFDAAAPEYDVRYEGLRGILRMRSITSHLYLRYFPAGGRLLEINCGTGNDAVFLARHGMKIVATDLSPRMLEEVQKKITMTGLQGVIETQLLPFHRLAELRGTNFDGIYSNLGGLNCTDRLNTVAADLAALVRPEGYFIATVMPPVCLWEICAYLARFQWKNAMRRFSREGTLADLHGGKVQTYYYSPRAFRTAFAPWFRHVGTLGVAIFTPPPNFVRSYMLLGKRIRFLEKLENHVAAFTPFSSMGDHYVIVLQRKSP